MDVNGIDFSTLFQKDSRHIYRLFLYGKMKRRAAFVIMKIEVITTIDMQQ